MPLHTAVRRIQFCAGHRVYKHESKCSRAHGHNYVGHFYARASRLDMVGRVVDFSVLKDRIGGWIDTQWDHAFIAYEQDGEMLRALGSIPGQHVFVAPFNPTAEQLAEHLLVVVCPEVLAGTGVDVYRVVLEETENCRAVAELPTDQHAPCFHETRY